jgi:hypothetical protein
MSKPEHIAPIVQRVLHRWAPVVFEYGWTIQRCQSCGVTKRLLEHGAEYWRTDRGHLERSKIPPPCTTKDAA